MLNSVKLTPLTALASVRVLATAVIVGLVFSASALQANQQTSTDEGWGEWQAMGNAYVARRRQPPRLNLPDAERQLANVQTREPITPNAQVLQAGSESRVMASTQSNAISNVNAKAKPVKVKTLWLQTGEEGLYSITVAELAAVLSSSAKNLRKKAKKGKINITTASKLTSKSASKAVSWHYDKASDSILFAAQVYNTFYSDKNAFKFKLTGKKARPMKIAGGSATANIGTDMPFEDKLKFEEEPDYYFFMGPVASEPNADYWAWDYLFGGTRDQFDVGLMIPNPSPSGKAQVGITLRGITNLYVGDEHEVWAELNGTPIGTSRIWDAFDKAVLEAEFDQSLLNASGDNTLTLHNSYDPGRTSIQTLDQVEVIYKRMPVALNDKLWMHKVVAGTQRVSGYSSDDIVVMEYPAGEAVLRQDMHISLDGSGGWQVEFEAQGGTDFLVVERNAAATAAITAYIPAKLAKTSNVANFLIIAPRDFTGTAERLAAYRKDQFSHVKIVWLDDIYSEFSAGRKDPAAIGKFMRHVIKKWKITPDAISLLGKGTLDELNRMQYSDSFLPVVLTSTPWALTASDSKLLGFEDNEPFTFARLPITNDAEGLAYLDKLMAYEASARGDERFEAVLIADNPDEAGSFHLNSDLLTTRLLDTLGFNQVTLLYHPIDSVRANLTDSNTWETGYVSYDGHGSTAQIGDSTNTEKFLTAGDASLLTNTLHPVFTALTCAAGDDTYPGVRSLAGALVLNPIGGAIVSVAPTGLSLDVDAQQLGNAFVDSLYDENMTVDEALLNAKTDTKGNILEFMSRMYSVVGVPGVYVR